MITDKTPEQVAQELVENEFPIDQYMIVQNRRIERLAYWKERNIQALIDNEQELVNFGEKVLLVMKKAYEQQ